MFGQVIKANPPYELEFAARIRQTEVFTGGNFQKVVKMLGQMAKSDKNKDLLDQVYYALGNVYMSREDTASAIRNYELGVEKSTRNGLDKAICQIKLGDLYFQKRDYVKAQPNFSGALSGIRKNIKTMNGSPSCLRSLTSWSCMWRRSICRIACRHSLKCPKRSALP